MDIWILSNEATREGKNLLWAAVFVNGIIREATSDVIESSPFVLLLLTGYQILISLCLYKKHNFLWCSSTIHVFFFFQNYDKHGKEIPLPAGIYGLVSFYIVTSSQTRKHLYSNALPSCPASSSPVLPTHALHPPPTAPTHTSQPPTSSSSHTHS